MARSFGGGLAGGDRGWREGNAALKDGGERRIAIRLGLLCPGVVAVAGLVGTVAG